MRISVHPPFSEIVAKRIADIRPVDKRYFFLSKIVVHFENKFYIIALLRSMN